MLKFRYSFVLLMMVLPFTVEAKFAFNENCIKAYKSILSLKVNEGLSILAIEKKVNPENKIPILLENYADFLKVLTSETTQSFEEFKNNKSDRIDLIEEDDPNSPWYLYSQAEINLQSCINRFKYQEFITGAYELQKSYKMLEENQKKFPDFLPNKKSFALLYGLVGLVPDQYKWALSTIGLKGNVQQGISMLEDLRLKLPTSSYAYLTDETIFFLSFIQMSAEGKDKVFESVIKNTENIPASNLLNVFIRAIVATRTGHTDAAIDMIAHRPNSSAYIPFYHLDYLMGLSKLSRFDEDAVSYFEYYLKNYKGTFNVKDSYLKIAWFYLLKGNIDKYNAYSSLCIVRGVAISEKDKDALSQAKQTHAPDIALLKARLYFDGGYYEKALGGLKEKKQESFPLPKDKLEYLYRMGRIYHQLNKEDQAILFYTSTISKGLELPYYFAANASLQLGFIYEKNKNYAKAKYYYTQSMKMKNEEYKNSIESKAKAGLKRLPN